jgi:hypothetical protein
MNDSKGATTTKQTELGKQRVSQLPFPVIEPRLQASFVSEMAEVQSEIGSLQEKLRRRAIFSSMI